MSTNHPIVPVHLGIIPDGNRRWAAANGLTPLEGHKRGYENLKKIGDAALARGVKYLTVYAFSTENWKRSPGEVKYLMGLLDWILTKEVATFHKKGIRLNFFGSPDGIDPAMSQRIEEATAKTAGNTRGTLNICFNYGGQTDIVEGVRKLLSNRADPKSVTVESFGESLTSAGTPPVDLVIRTSGEMRLSNFLLWEAAYAELYFPDVMWPDFDEVELDKALAEYADRNRRFGS